MVSVALTGGVGAGKSEVLRLWKHAGVPVVSADELSRRAVEPGSEGLAEIRSAFGDEVIGSDGALDRARLRAIVFSDTAGADAAAARRRLEAITHPRIAALRERWTRDRAAEGHPLVVAEVPLLFEAGLETEFDVTVVVDAPDDARVRRLTETRGLPEAEARRIMAAQMDPAEKRSRADHVIMNDGTLDQLEVRSAELLERLRAEAAA